MPVLVLILSFLGMEFIAWFSHKYIMHGLLWEWHKDHHQPRSKKPGFWEKNDRFFLVFAIPSALFYLVGGLIESMHLFLYAGIGISIYGLVYFLIHDVYIHRRFKIFRHLHSRYSRAILRAHGAHHAVESKEGCVSFGLLIVHPKYFRSRKKR